VRELACGRTLIPCDHHRWTARSLESQAEDGGSRALEIEADRILDVADRAGVVLRLEGSVAILGRCPNHALLASGDHVFRDIDFAARKQEVRDIHELLARLGYVEDREVFVASEGARAIFGSAYKGVHVDVFYEKLDFCHAIHLQDRLRIDAPTLPLAELLLANSPRRVSGSSQRRNPIDRGTMRRRVVCQIALLRN
jgi:hypothetical protein